MSSLLNLALFTLMLASLGACGSTQESQLKSKSKKEKDTYNRLFERDFGR